MRLLASTCLVVAGLFVQTSFAQTKPVSLTVAADGSSEYKTVQSAVDALPQDASEKTIVIKPGRYYEKIVFPKTKPNIHIKSEDADPSKTILTFDLWAQKVGEDGKNVGTRNSASVVVDAADFVAENLTFENPSGEKGQAVAVRTTGDKQIFRNCRFLGGQDTLYANGGRTYFDRCYIEGRVDFIFGRATAVFDHCVINSKNGGFVTAPSTNPEQTFGYVFLDCKLTSTGEQKALLGRPWRPNGASAFIRCEIGDHIGPEGWNNWGKVENETTARFAEHGNTGPGASTKARVPWAKQLTADEAAKYTVENILGGTDNWHPRAK